MCDRAVRPRNYVKTALTDPFCIYLLLFAAIIFTVTILFLIGLRDVAWIVSYGGTVLVVVGSVVFVAAFDPEHKWPNATFSQRLTNVLAFRRGEGRGR